MSSPPTSSTSNKVAQLSYRSRRFHLRSSSFAAIIPFRKRKPSPREPASEVPYEVAPGIWSNEATAKVFGYLESAKLKKDKSIKLKTSESKQGPIPDTRTPSPAKKLLNLYKEVHNDDGTDDFRNRTHVKKRKSKADLIQERRDEARKGREENESRSRRGRMGTVSKDDTLLIRYANPRTGMISPFVTSKVGSLDSGYSSDYVGVRPRAAALKNQHSWKQDKNGWSLIDPQPSPHSNQPGQAVDGRLLVDKPGVANHSAASMSMDQIKRYQEGMKKALKNVYSGNGFGNPFEAATPREATPESKSPPPMFLHRIKRKAVGGSTGRRDGSTGTVIINEQLRSSSMPTPKRPPRVQHRVQIITPAHSSIGTFSKLSNGDKPSAFLGPPPMMNWNPGTLPLPTHIKDRVPPQKREIPPFHEDSEAFSDRPQASSNLDPQNRLPIPRLPHSARSMPQLASCPHPENFNPPSLRQNHSNQAVTNARTTTTTTPTTPPAFPKIQNANPPNRRPRPLEQHVSAIYVPRVRPREARLEGEYDRPFPTKAVTHPTMTAYEATASIDTQRRRTEAPAQPSQRQASNPLGRNPVPAPASNEAPCQNPSETYNGWVIADPETEVCPSATPSTPVSSNHNTHKPRGQRPRNPTDDIGSQVWTGRGSTPTSVLGFEGSRRRNSDQVGARRQGSGDAKLGMETRQATCELKRQSSFHRQLNEVRTLWRDVSIAIPSWVLVQSLGRQVLVRGCGMVYHVLTTLSPRSRALEILKDGGKDGVGTEEYWDALREVVRAGWYLLVLVCGLVVLGRVGRMVLGILGMGLGVLRVGWWVLRWMVVS